MLQDPWEDDMSGAFLWCSFGDCCGVVRELLLSCEELFIWSPGLLLLTEIQNHQRAFLVGGSQ